MPVRVWGGKVPRDFLGLPVGLQQLRRFWGCLWPTISLVGGPHSLRALTKGMPSCLRAVWLLLLSAGLPGNRLSTPLDPYFRFLRPSELWALLGLSWQKPGRGSRWYHVDEEVVTLCRKLGVAWTWSSPATARAPVKSLPPPHSGPQGSARNLGQKPKVLLSCRGGRRGRVGWSSENFLEKAVLGLCGFLALARQRPGGWVLGEVCWPPALVARAPALRGKWRAGPAEVRKFLATASWWADGGRPRPLQMACFPRLALHLGAVRSCIGDMGVGMKTSGQVARG